MHIFAACSTRQGILFFFSREALFYRSRGSKDADYSLLAALPRPLLCPGRCSAADYSLLLQVSEESLHAQAELRRANAFYRYVMYPLFGNWGVLNGEWKAHPGDTEVCGLHPWEPCYPAGCPCAS